MSSPIIGVFATLSASSSGTFIDVERQTVNSRYIASVEEAGGIPFIIPVSKETEKTKKLIDLCDGFLFPGGEDIDPRCYGENPNQALGEIRPEVDEFLIHAFGCVLEQRKPAMGICKGMQLMVVAMGGKLYQDIYSQRPEETYLHGQLGRRTYGIHCVSIESESHLCRILQTDRIFTNSMHHQSVRMLGHGLDVVARTDDGIVEGVESKDGRLIGVQWHPEEMTAESEPMKRLFKNLVEKAAE